MPPDSTRTPEAAEAPDELFEAFRRLRPGRDEFAAGVRKRIAEFEQDKRDREARFAAAPERLRWAASIMPPGLVAGAWGGYVLGDRADDALARGDPLGWEHRWAVRGGTVLTGATVGLAIAGLGADVDNSEDYITGALIGAAGGVVLQLFVDGSLSPSPAVHVGLVPEAKGLSLGVRWDF